MKKCGFFYTEKNIILFHLFIQKRKLDFFPHLIHQLIEKPVER